MPVCASLVSLCKTGRVAMPDKRRYQTRDPSIYNSALSNHEFLVNWIPASNSPEFLGEDTLGKRIPVFGFGDFDRC